MIEQLKKMWYISLAVIIGNLIAYKMFNIPNQFEIVFLFSLLLFYPILRRPIIGIYLVFIILPFISYIRKLYYLVHERPDIDPLIMVGEIIIIFILLGLFRIFKDILDNTPKTRRYFVAIILYTSYMFFRTIVFNITPFAEAITSFKFYGPSAIFFIIAMAYAWNTKHLKAIWLITILIGSIAALYGIKQLYIGYSEAEILWFSSINFSTLFIDGRPRPFSLFKAPVIFADFMQITLIGILISTSWIKNNSIKLLYILMPVIFYGVLITSVRSNWIGIIITFALWYIFLKIKRTWARVTVLISLGFIYYLVQFAAESVAIGVGFQETIGGLISLLPNSDYSRMLIADRTTALYNPLEEHSFLSRLSLWRDIIIFSKEPINAILGRGIGSLKTDSLYFTYLAELGYPGLIMILYIFVHFIKAGFYIINTDTNYETIALAKGVVTMNIIFAIISITGTHIHSFPGDIFFWFWNGVLLKRYIDIRYGNMSVVKQTVSFQK